MTCYILFPCLHSPSFPLHIFWPDWRPWRHLIVCTFGVAAPLGDTPLATVGRTRVLTAPPCFVQQVAKTSRWLEDILCAVAVFAGAVAVAVVMVMAVLLLLASGIFGRRCLARRVGAQARAGLIQTGVEAVVASMAVRWRVHCIMVLGGWAELHDAAEARGFPHWRWRDASCEEVKLVRVDV